MRLSERWDAWGVLYQLAIALLLPVFLTGTTVFAFSRFVLETTLGLETFAKTTFVCFLLFLLIKWVFSSIASSATGGGSGDDGFGSYNHHGTLSSGGRSCDSSDAGGGCDGD